MQDFMSCTQTFGRDHDSESSGGPKQADLSSWIGMFRLITGYFGCHLVLWLSIQ